MSIVMTSIKKYPIAYPRKANIHKIPDTNNICPYVSLFLFPTKSKNIPKQISIGTRDIIVTTNPYILATNISEGPQDEHNMWGSAKARTVNAIPIIPAFFKSFEDLFSRGWFFEE